MAAMKVVFYVEPEWAYGVIHYDLSNYLTEFGITSSVMPWSRAYTTNEVEELAPQIDCFISSTTGINILNKEFKIIPEKCIAVAHSREDLVHLRNMGVEVIARLKSFGVISTWLKEQSKILGITRLPLVASLGVNTKRFHAEPPERLETLGYAGAYKIEHNNHIKRAHLVDEVATRVKLPLKVAQLYHNSFTTMPGFYPTVDCIIVSSTWEGAGLPALEAGSAGRLVISTPVGHWNKVSPRGAIEVPIEEREFVERSVETIQFYKNNPREFRNRCVEIRQHAIKQYDWASVIQEWVNLINNEKH
jgi:glycosyltransferase involved in cell wall biosynthesis